MYNENYSIIFSSMTGNTRKLADKIHEILPKESCDYFGTADAQGIKSELLYIGFWTDKGNADSDTLDFLSKLKNKKIFLFGTAGFGGSDAYFQKILGNVKSAIDSSNTIVGEYMCQGKMPQSVRERYVKMKENPEHPDNIDALIEVLESFLGFTNMHKAFLFGVGSLGGALLRDSGLRHFGLEIVAAFDVNPELAGKDLGGIPIFHSDDFEAKMKEYDVNIGVLTVPINIAQEITNKMVDGGIKAVWNFTPFRIRVPENIVVQNTSLYAHLAVMFNRLNFNEK